MNEITRRNALALSTLGVLSATCQIQADAKAPNPSDKERVMACGLTADEAECWELIGKAAGKFFELPKLHPMDDHEVAHAVHVIQNKLLSRPAYRKYLGKDGK